MANFNKWPDVRRPGDLGIGSASAYNAGWDKMRILAGDIGGPGAHRRVTSSGVSTSVYKARKRQRVQPQPLQIYRVRVRQAGGDPGGSTTRCTFAYDLFPYVGAWEDVSQGEPIAVAVARVWGRCDEGRYRAAFDGTEALAARDPNLLPEDPDYWFLLYVADEVPETAICFAGTPEGG